MKGNWDQKGRAEERRVERYILPRTFFDKIKRSCKRRVSGEREN
jgi:hypothetical protein